MIQMPAIIPAPSQEFSFGVESNTVRTTMDSGLIRQRKTGIFKRYRASLKWQLTAEEFLLFCGFLEYEANDGVSWFESLVYTSASLKWHKIRLVNGVYQASYQSWGGWVVTAEADLEEVEKLDSITYLITKENGFESLVNFANLMEVLVNQKLPNNPNIVI